MKEIFLEHNLTLYIENIFLLVQRSYSKNINKKKNKNLGLTVIFFIYIFCFHFLRYRRWVIYDNSFFV